jgi:hypothetical protein
VYIVGQSPTSQINKQHNMTPSEEFAYEFANQTFIPFWSFENPIGKKDKELCDALVICDNVGIVISVKEIKVSEGKNIDVQYER